MTATPRDIAAATSVLFGMPNIGLLTELQHLLEADAGRHDLIRICLQANEHNLIAKMVLAITLSNPPASTYFFGDIFTILEQDTPLTAYPLTLERAGGLMLGVLESLNHLDKAGWNAKEEGSRVFRNHLARVIFSQSIEAGVPSLAICGTLTNEIGVWAGGPEYKRGERLADVTIILQDLNHRFQAEKDLPADDRELPTPFGAFICEKVAYLSWNRLSLAARVEAINLFFNEMLGWALVDGF